MAIKVGSEGYGDLVFSKIYVGSTQVTKVYLGSDLVYSTSGGGGGSSTTRFAAASGLTSSGAGTATDPLAISGDLAATNPLVTFGNIAGGYALVEANVSTGSHGDDDQQLSLMKNSTSVGNFFDTDSWGGSYKFTLAPSEDDTLGLSRSNSGISTTSVEFSSRAETSVNFDVTKESDSTTNSGQQYVEFSLDAGDFPLYLWGIKVSVSGNRTLYGSTTAFTGAVIYQEKFTTQPTSLIYNHNRTNATGNTNASNGDVLDLKRFIVNGESILRLYSYSGYELSNLTILVEPVTHLRETITNYQTGTITGATIAEDDD